MAKPGKADVVAKLKERLETSNAALLTEYRGLTVEKLKELRRSLMDNASYSVVKNTLTTIAAKEAGFDGIVDQLSGPTAIAFVSGDAVEVAKALKAFAKDNEQLVIKGGIFEGEVLSSEEVLKLADLESREVLLAKAASAMKGGLYKAAATVAAPAAQAARAFGALSAKLEEAA